MSIFFYFVFADQKNKKKQIDALMSVVITWQKWGKVQEVWILLLPTVFWFPFTFFKSTWKAPAAAGIKQIDYE